MIPRALTTLGPQHSRRIDNALDAEGGGGFWVEICEFATASVNVISANRFFSQTNAKFSK
jgi:hypothetical protein